MKKITVFVLTLCLLLGCLFLPSSAESRDVISLRLNSNVAGCTDDDAGRLIEILSPQVTYYTDGRGPVHVSDYAGFSLWGQMEAGRSYYLEYTLVPAEGYTLPDELSEGDVSVDCGKGVSLISCRVINLSVAGSSASTGRSTVRKVLRLTATVVVDGNPFQRLIGVIKDIFLKIRTWQLY